MENIDKCKCRCATIAVSNIRNELIEKLNENVDRYIGECSCKGYIYPDNEYFCVDDIYEVIDEVVDRALEGMIEDDF